MPAMDGYEVARWIRRQPNAKPIVLVALTGWGQQEDRRQSADAGFDHHLVKPAEPDALHALLASVSRGGQHRPITSPRRGPESVGGGSSGGVLASGHALPFPAEAARTSSTAGGAALSEGIARTAQP